MSTMAHAGGSRDDLEALLHVTGQLWCAGVEVDWRAFWRDQRRRRRIQLPTYPFERTTHVLEAPHEQVRRRAGAPPAVCGEQPGGEDDPTSVMAAIWRELLGVPDVQAADNFFDLGSDSLLAVQMRSAVKDRLGIDLPIHALLERTTFGALLAAIRRSNNLPLVHQHARVTPPTAPLLVQLQSSSPSVIPLVLLQRIGGTVYTYRTLARELGSDQPVHAFRASGLEPGEPVDADVPSIAARYLRELLAAQPEGPYAIGGHSSGGVIAYELANQLLDMGREVALLVMVDATTAEQSRELPISAVEDVLALFERFAPIAPTAWRAFSTALRESPTLREVVVQTNKALQSYEPRRKRAPILYVRARERDDVLAPHPEAWWMNLADGPFDVHNVPGNHFAMMEHPHFTAVARIIRRFLDALERSREDSTARVADPGSESSETTEGGVTMEEREVRGLVARFFLAYEQRDLATVSEFFAHDDNILFHGTQVNLHFVGWPALEDSLRRQFEVLEDIRISVDDHTLFVRILAGGSAACIGTKSLGYKATRAKRLFAVQNIRMTATLERLEDRWVFVQMHWSLPDREIVVEHVDYGTT